MPGGFPLGFEVCQQLNIGASPGAGSQGTSVAASASANTLGSWVPLIASTASDICYVLLQLQYFNATTSSTAVDIGVGASGSERVVVPQVISMAGSAQNSGGSALGFPLAIPAGTRVAARSQASITGSQATFVSLQAFDGAFTQLEGYAGYDAIGFNTATTLGTLVNGNAAANTPGSYTPIIASTARDYAGFFMVVDSQNVAPSTTADVGLIDIAIGAASAEQQIVTQYAEWIFGGGSGISNISAFMPIPIPAGSRITGRLTCRTGNDKCGLTLYAAYQ